MENPGLIYLDKRKSSLVVQALITSHVCFSPEVQEMFRIVVLKNQSEIYFCVWSSMILNLIEITFVAVHSHLAHLNIYFASQ